MANIASMLGASETPGILSLSEWLGVTPARARRILEKSVQWRSWDRENGSAWSAKVGRHIIFVGGLALDGRVTAQVMQMFCDRLNIIISAADDAPCMVGNGRVMTAGDIRLDLEKWFRPNGISCPGCGADMLDWEPDHVLYSDPPQVRVHCVECEHIGYGMLVKTRIKQAIKTITYNKCVFDGSSWAEIGPALSDLPLDDFSAMFVVDTVIVGIVRRVWVGLPKELTENEFFALLSASDGVPHNTEGWMELVVSRPDCL